MSYQYASETSFNAGKKHMDIMAKWDVPHQIWDAPQPGDDDDQVGAHPSVTLDLANQKLAPFNMVVGEGLLWGTRRWFLSVLDPEKPWPSNWCSLADTVVMCPADEPLPRARFGRYKWPPAEQTA